MLHLLEMMVFYANNLWITYLVGTVSTSNNGGFTSIRTKVVTSMKF
jgi:hypothetical protein